MAVQSIEAINARHTCKCCGAIDIEVDRSAAITHCRKCGRHAFPCKILEVA